MLCLLPPRARGLRACTKHAYTCARPARSGPPQTDPTRGAARCPSSHSSAEHRSARGLLTGNSKMPGTRRRAAGGSCRHGLYPPSGENRKGLGGAIHQHRPLWNVDVDLPRIVGLGLICAASLPTAELLGLRVQRQPPSHAAAPTCANAVITLVPLGLAQVQDAEGCLLRFAASEESEDGAAAVFVHEAAVVLHEPHGRQAQAVGGRN
mmetsp:Transcript_29852/g.86698  ORF Transcript_29852/g.86698 Transcript_29852/m.86698 type:complete len:208 (-) Transcript_29852:1505-2128(-)